MLNQMNLEEELTRLKDDLLGECLEQLQFHSEKAAYAEAAYKVGYAKAMLASTYKTVADREADSIVKNEGQLLDKLIHDRAVTTAREKLAAYRSSIDACRTMMVGLRENLRS